MVKNMDYKEILEKISKKDFNKLKYVHLILKDEKFRDFVVDNMLNHPKIMYYYHCFYILEKASEMKPYLFYIYWDKFSSLLKHSNSYHRNFGLILLANLAVIDTADNFSNIIDDYLGLLSDVKFMTAEVCIKNLFKVALAKSHLAKKIVSILLNFSNFSLYSDKQTSLGIGFIIEGLDVLFDKLTTKKPEILQFVQSNSSSISPKTRKIARDFLKKYNQ